MADDNTTNTVTLRSSDGVEFEVSSAVASKSQVLRLLIEDDCSQDDAVIPIYNVNSTILSRVIEYCTMHVFKGSFIETYQEDLLKRWDNEFIDNIDVETLKRVINAANYLDVGDLLDLTCRRVTEMLMVKSTEEIREILNVENDFGPGEEEAIRRANGWAFL